MVKKVESRLAIKVLTLSSPRPELDCSQPI